ncbi:hypothetical protein ASPWEDRAFT_42353 [Aspergillus wentii DTO 134E9]|uniref:FAM86 N-terminal domain-containing protein n=1 Tax=Aspergillus wentii DTO 134E9 TaxID=1073089 RepID=A0A1L9RHP9_ASPWE|nr:uncharacterized protein ASPWEDRAFT_42353 [Aspergillus wentii DTO 134E9]OJJ34363.1 hypothetical protein ASPWEDRAFT_42353 [Aspergillus wentii DTO 134E9]
MDEINTLVAQYFQLVDPHHLNLPDGPTIVKPAIQTALYERMFNEDTVWPIPPVNYRSRVLKMIISRIEESISDPEEDEIISDLMETWSTLMTTPKPSPLQQAQQLSYIKYTAPTTTASTVTTPRTVITSESRGLILSAGTTGFRTWEAALHLGSFLATPAGEALVRGKRVIELGAGTGFLSMFAAKYLGVQRVVVTDREEALLDSIRDCVGRNELDGRVLRPAIWEWGSPLDFEKGDDGEDGVFDVALGADLVCFISISFAN